MDRAKLVAALKRDEGLRLKPYTDTTGHLTIGCGRNLTDVGITLDEAEALLEHDIDRVVGELNQRPWFARLSDVRQRAIVNMAFNLGLSGLLSFTQMIAALEHGRYTTAAREMMESRWAAQVKMRADRIATMMITDQDVEP